MPTIAGTLRSSARRVPEAEALAFGDSAYTYRELDATVDTWAGGLRALNVAKGDRVAVMSTNSDLFVIAFYAVLRAGAIFVPINPASAPPEIDHVVGDCGTDVLLYAASLKSKVDAMTVPVGHRVALEEFTPGDRSMCSDDEVGESDDALILYTSGTTGKAKGALFDHHRSICVAMAMIATCGMRAGDRFLHVAPLYHAAEMGIMLVPGTLLGVKHVVLPAFDPATVLEVMERERITMFFGVPTMFQLMMRVPDAAARDLSAWRTGLFGAAPMPPSAVEQLIATWQDVQFMQLCGQTEGGPTGIYSTHEQVIARPDASGRQGVVLTEARVVDTDGVPVAPGATGELALRSESVMKGYWDNPDASAETLRNGWLHTGDIARIDDDGYITLVDRLKDMIISGGRNVYSIEVESVLAACPGVRDVAVIGRPHADYGESIVAVLDTEDGTTPSLEDIRSYCQGRIADYKIPHDVIASPVPRNASGKALKHVLRERLGVGK